MIRHTFTKMRLHLWAWYPINPLTKPRITPGSTAILPASIIIILPVIKRIVSSEDWVSHLQGTEFELIMLQIPLVCYFWDRLTWLTRIIIHHAWVNNESQVFLPRHLIWEGRTKNFAENNNRKRNQYWQEQRKSLLLKAASITWTYWGRIREKIIVWAWVIKEMGQMPASWVLTGRIPATAGRTITNATVEQCSRR